MQDAQIKGGAHSRSYGRRLQAEKIAAPAPREGAPPGNIYDRDWLMLVALAGLVLGLALLGLISREPKLGKPLYLHPEVVITGAVAEPGSYQLRSTAKVRDLLALAHPLPGADLTKISKNRAIAGGTLKVPYRSPILVDVEGAVVREGWYCVGEGETVGDLLRQVELLEGAQTRNLKKREKLAAGDRIAIPFRKK